MTRLGWRRAWPWAARLALVVVLAQACGGDSGKTTGASGGTEISLDLKGVELSQLAAGCTGRLTATRPGFAPRSATIPPSGVVTLFLAPGEWTFLAEIDCPQAGGTTRRITAQQTASVGQGNLVLNFPVGVNASPRVAVSCGSPCQCQASDPDGDPLSASWSSTGGSLSSLTGFSTDVTCPSGTCEVTCTVTDGRGGVASATATVGVQLVTLTVTVTSSYTSGDTVSSTPPGLSCTTPPLPNTCSATFPLGSSATLSASPISDFLAWGLACSGTSPTCTLILNANTTVTASFL